MTPPVIEHASHAALAEGLADIVADRLRKAIAARGRAAMATAGGGTPGPFLSVLSARPLDWAKVALMPTDERWAAPKDPRSNERMVRETLFAAGAAPDFLSFWREGMAIDAAARDVARAVAPHLPLDICVLGMGADMHCASLFPGGDGLAQAMAEDGAPLVSAITAPGAAEPRLTLSASALAAAGAVLLLITGAEKRAALDRAFAAGDPLSAPVAGVLGRARHVEIHWAA